MPWARASALERHLECPAASWLPRLDRRVWSPGYLQAGVIELPPVPDEVPNTSAADHGTAMHEAKAGTGVEPFMSQVDPFREEFWPEGLGVHEQCVAYDCRTGEVIIGPTNVPREEADAWKEAQGPDCVVACADWWASLPSGEPWVSDLKTGWRRPEVATPQTLFYLMCKCMLDGWDFGRLSIDWWPKKEPAPTRDGLWRQVSGLALEAFKLDVQAAWRRAVIVPNPAARPGPWCGYCPSWRACPAIQGEQAEEKLAA